VVVMFLFYLIKPKRDAQANGAAGTVAK